MKERTRIAVASLRLLGAVALVSLAVTPVFAWDGGWDSGANCPAGSYDILGWMTPSDGTASVHGRDPNNPWNLMYYHVGHDATNYQRGQVLRTLSAVGDWWDMFDFDENTISILFTGSNPVFYNYIPPTGSPNWYVTPHLYAPRCMVGGNPGPAYFSSHPQAVVRQYFQNCDPTLTTSQVDGYYFQKLWGPSGYQFGGESAPEPTIVVQGLWGCQSDYQNCAAIENHYYQRGRGMVYYQEYHRSNGQYFLFASVDLSQTVSGAIPAYVPPCSLQ